MTITWWMLAFAAGFGVVTGIYATAFMMLNRSEDTTEEW